MFEFDTYINICSWADAFAACVLQAPDCSPCTEHYMHANWSDT